MNSLIPAGDFDGIKPWFVMGTLGGEVNVVYVFPREGILAIVYPNLPGDFIWKTLWQCHQLQFSHTR